MRDLKLKLDEAVEAGRLLPASRENVLRLLEGSASPVEAASVWELVETAEWTELNDRFYRTLAFGTGGLRGRSIGRTVTAAENGTPSEIGRPEWPCVGTNAMNYHNISRATRGLVLYLQKWMRAEGRTGRPKLVFAHDTRHFSREFAELAAQVAVENGCDAALFAGPRSTPELSFALRRLDAQAGAVITASHNPPHDNGFKVYFGDGAQVVEPHAGGIIAEVNALVSASYEPVPAGERGRLQTLGEEMDEAYLDKLVSLVLDPKMVAEQTGLKIVFTPIHGTGGVIIKPAYERLGFSCQSVAVQDEMDGRFPTVKSPNPENAEALALAIEQADRTDADLMIATDPDCDRMGVAVRNTDGKMELFTGNQIGSLMAWYRVTKLFELGVLTPRNAKNAVIIKTFVTSDLQKAIAEKAGLHCVETLTGFKYIGEKLGKYENALPDAFSGRYRELAEEDSRDARLRFSKYYVFGGEESYGYSGADFVRDKDANGAAIMFAEVAAYAKSRKLTLDALLDRIYGEFGYYLERNASLVFEGAEGAAKIARLIASYAEQAPGSIDGSPVESALNFAEQEILDSEGELLPKEKMIIFTLGDGRRVAVRPSGTEPKIKYYMFARRAPSEFSAAELDEVKDTVDRAIQSLWSWLEADATRRAG